MDSTLEILLKNGNKKLAKGYLQYIKSYEDYSKVDIDSITDSIRRFHDDYPQQCFSVDVRDNIGESPNIVVTSMKVTGDY